MLKPSRRRWYHRYAVIERRIDGDGAARPLSWHLTQGGALRAVDELYAEALLLEHLDLQDWFVGQPLSAPHEEWQLFRPVRLMGPRHSAG